MWRFQSLSLLARVQASSHRLSQVTVTSVRDTVELNLQWTTATSWNYSISKPFHSTWIFCWIIFPSPCLSSPSLFPFHLLFAREPMCAVSDQPLLETASAPLYSVRGSDCPCNPSKQTYITKLRSRFWVYTVPFVFTCTLSYNSDADSRSLSSFRWGGDADKFPYVYSRETLSSVIF